MNLENGFNLRGRVSHYEDSGAFDKSGYYFRGDSQIRRSLYIGDVLYTFSNKKIQLNDLTSLEKIKSLIF